MEGILLRKAWIVCYLKSRLPLGTIMIDIEIGTLVETVQLWSWGWRGEIIVDVRKAGKHQRQRCLWKSLSTICTHTVSRRSSPGC